MRRENGRSGQDIYSCNFAEGKSKPKGKWQWKGEPPG
jgi:hypothetical protein